MAQATFNADVTQFQSTHPVRGATLRLYASRRSAIISIHAPREGCDQCCEQSYHQYQISIHAPREGCDCASYTYMVTPSLFQSTHPVRGATLAQCIGLIVSRISIHAPREGCDYRGANYNRTIRISIHAPREGCDRKNGLHISKYGYSTHSTASIVPYDSPAFSPICESAESICQQITHS